MAAERPGRQSGDMLVLKEPKNKKVTVPDPTSLVLTPISYLVDLESTASQSICLKWESMHPSGCVS